MKHYKYIVVGAGVAGCSVAHFLKNEDVLLVDRFEDVAQFASGTAGGFLSPLLGKPNKFKDLVTTALKFSIDFYKALDESLIIQKGVVRIPQNDEDKEKFEVYKEYIDFDFIEMEEGLFFDIGAQILSYDICKKMIEGIETKFNYDIKHIKNINENSEEIWILNDEISCENLILTTGCDTFLLDEKYLNIRAVWGQRIDISTTTCINKNYHKECSLSTSNEILDDGLYKVSIGATHHRFEALLDDVKLSYKEPTFDNFEKLGYTEELYNLDTEELLKKASDIKALENVKVIKKYFAPRASSFDYFPIVGSVIDSNKTIDIFPYLKNGTHVRSERFERYKKLFMLNGVGGRGFVLSPYLAKKLVDFIKNKTPLEDDITCDRLFKRWVRKIK